MPVSPTYPGVYVEEIASGVRTISGIATSITAFIGRALRGPVNEPVSIQNYGDYERNFGGLWANSTMSYAVRDFYRHGGGRAVIVRLFHPPTDENNGIAIIVLGKTDKKLQLEASSPGSWGNKLTASIDYSEGIEEDVAKQFNLTDKDLFNLTITDTSSGGRTERFLNLSVINSARRVDRVLAQESQLVRVSTLSKNRPEKAESVKATEVKEGSPLTRSDYLGSEISKTGLHALEKTDLFNMLCIPADERDGDTNLDVYEYAINYCEKRRAVLIVDPPAAWGSDPTSPSNAAKNGVADLKALSQSHAALYFPRLVAPDPLREGQLDTFVPCGAVAGVIARTDAERGVWKAPAGLDAVLSGINGLQTDLTDDENGMLNPLGINCLRNIAASGHVIWGARTLRGADHFADEYKYLPVRRLALYIEESLYRGTQWVVFEENDEPLWAQIRLNIGGFMQTLFRKGAFQGMSPREAYFVKCDREATTQGDINRGVVNIVVGFAPLKPAEFVIIKLQQIAGQIEA